MPGKYGPTVGLSDADNMGLVPLWILVPALREGYATGTGTATLTGVSGVRPPRARSLNRMSADPVDVVKPPSVPVAYPSTGALIGSILGAIFAGKLGFNPADPTGASIAGALAATLSAVFNQIGKWLHF